MNVIGKLVRTFWSHLVMSISKKCSVRIPSPASQLKDSCTYRPWVTSACPWVYIALRMRLQCAARAHMGSYSMSRSVLHITCSGKDPNLKIRTYYYQKVDRHWLNYLTWLQTFINDIDKNTFIRDYKLSIGFIDKHVINMLKHVRISTVLNCLLNS